jgi:hypothetical protein
MKIMKPLTQTPAVLGGLTLALVLAATAPSARANVYATNIKLNSSLASIPSAQGSPVTISYILNEPATLGTTIQILAGSTLINTISNAPGSPGSLRGLNTVIWGGTNSSGAVVPTGTYSVTITPATMGFTNWTQTSVDTNSGMAAYLPYGIDVDRNTNSAYYGRVVMGCATGSGTPPARDGLYKMNADGTQADEGWYGYAGYDNDDGSDGPTPGRMPSSGGFNPQTIRIGEDDRIYWCDNTAMGAIIACDILATTNQVVITEGTYINTWYNFGGRLQGPYNYENNPLISYLAHYGWGIRQFDVCAANTTNAAVYLVDTGDFPNWGVWMYHLTNGVSDPNDTVGTQAITAGGTDFIVTGAGIMVDYNLDIFVSQNRSHGNDTFNRSFLYTNWNGGVLPPGGSSMLYAEGNGTPPAAWAVGSGDTNMTAIWDTAIDSRAHPTLVAVAMAGGETNVIGGYNNQNGGIRVLSAVDGSIAVSNLDLANWYNGVAFDNVGNVYGCSRSTNLWRVWSPPGTNQATTVAVPTVKVVVPPHITSISAAAGTVTIHFTGDPSDSASDYTLVSSATVGGTYSPASGAVITGSAGTFTATVPAAGDAQFYRIRR